MQWICPFKEPRTGNCPFGGIIPQIQRISHLHTVCRYIQFTKTEHSEYRVVELISRLLAFHLVEKRTYIGHSDFKTVFLSLKNMIVFVMWPLIQWKHLDSFIFCLTVLKHFYQINTVSDYLSEIISYILVCLEYAHLSQYQIKWYTVCFSGNYWVKHIKPCK